LQHVGNLLAIYLFNKQSLRAHTLLWSGILVFFKYPQTEKIFSDESSFSMLLISLPFSASFVFDIEELNHPPLPIILAKRAQVQGRE